MRKKISEMKEVRAGQTVRISVKWHRNAKPCVIAVFAKHGSGDLCPFVQHALNGAVGVSDFHIYNPMHKVITEENRIVEFEFKAESDMQIAVMQEIEFQTDELLKARISIHGKAANSLRRYFGISGWPLRRIYASALQFIGKWR